jgi:hypothetical protein
MLPEDFAPLDVSRYELKLRALEPVSLPSFLGSTLRGAFGHALKDAVCVMNHRNCERCMVAERCIYPYLFETPAPAGLKLLKGQQHAPHPFILTPPVLNQGERVTKKEKFNKANGIGDHNLSDGRVKFVPPPRHIISDGRRALKRGDELTFGLLLIGRATEYMPYVVYAVSEMGRRGLGMQRGRFELTEVAVIDRSSTSRVLYSGHSQRITVPDGATTKLSDLINSRLTQLQENSGSVEGQIHLRFLTPTRIRVEGDLQVTLTFDLLVRNLLRRVSMLTLIHGKASLELGYREIIELASSIKTISSLLRWWDWERYSNRQRTTMSLGGFVGEINYEADSIQHFLPLLVAGEMLHIGAGTTFGLGRYEIVSPVKTYGTSDAASSGDQVCRAFSGSADTVVDRDTIK